MHALSSNGALLQLNATSTPRAPPRVVLSTSSKRLVRKSIRPATAPAQELELLLPSLPIGQIMGIPDSSSEYSSSLCKGKERETLPYMQTVDENDNDRIFDVGSGDYILKHSSYTHDHTEHLRILGYLPSPFGRDGDEFPPSPGADALPQSDCDWATFIIAYASGRWDPHRTPNPPRPFLTSFAGHSVVSAPSSSNISSDPADSGAPSDSPRVISSDAPQTHSPLQSNRMNTSMENVSKPESAPPGTSRPTPSVTTPSNPVNLFRASAPIKIPLPAYRMRNSFSTSSAPASGNDTIVPTSSAHSNAELHTAVATMRWAAARVDISPLALPSPEHELTDPMRGVTATVPGSHSPEPLQPDHPLTPGVIRKSRSFWHGTTDVENDSSKLSVSSRPQSTTEAIQAISVEVDALPNKEDSASGNQLEIAPVILTSAFNHQISHPHIATPPATVPPQPSEHHTNGPLASGDYFGTAHLGTQDSNGGIMSAPALPRRVSLTRQTSSPLPVLTPHEPVILGGRVVPDSGRVGRAAREEQIYAELGYLAAPNPPDELERKRALYKCDSSRHYFGPVPTDELTIGSTFGKQGPTSILTG